MDNVTHTLFGVVLARAMPASRSGDARKANAYLWTSLVASNLPDGDILHNLIGENSPFTYLLHHRGYTHTLLVAVPLGLLAAGGVSAITRTRFTLPLAALGVAASLLHLAADLMNDYGVHLLSPFMNRWFYGDLVFIVEPYLWLSMLPFAFQQIESRYFKALWICIGMAMLGLLWWGPFTSVGVTLTVMLWGMAMILLQRKEKNSPRRALALVMTSVFLIISTFSIASYQVKQKMEAYAKRLTPQEALMDIVATPAPANPFCWRAWLVTDAENVTYVSRLAAVSLLPDWISPETCYRGLDSERTVELLAPTMPPDPSVAWKGEYRFEQQAFELLEERYCDFRKYLKFSRLPFVQEKDGQMIAGDLRYDREPGLGFSEVILDPDTSQNCLEGSVPWESPFFRSH